MSGPPRILLFGKNGQLGRALQQSLQPLGQLVALDRQTQEYCGDLTRPQAIADTIRALRPAVIVNAAAYTAVDKAESEPELAHLVNATTPGVMSHEAEKIGAWLVHYSTDYVFDGSGTRPWRETDVPAPLNSYGRSKLAGEQRVTKAGSKHLILRTSWVYGVHGNNFLKTMLRLAQERDTLNVVNDQVGAPTNAAWLAQLTATLMPQILANDSLAGLYQAAAAGETSWHGYARFVIDCARKRGAAIKVENGAIRPVSSDQFPTPARRPLNSRLDTGRLRQTFGVQPPDWQTGVMQMLADLDLA